MLFVHGKQEEGHHNQHHTHCSGTVSNWLFEQKEKRNTYKRSAAETNQLSFGHIKNDLGFYFRQVFWYWYIRHQGYLLVLVCIEDRFCKAARLKECKA